MRGIATGKRRENKKSRSPRCGKETRDHFADSDSARDAALLSPDTVPDTMPSMSEISPPDDASDEAGASDDGSIDDAGGATDETWDDVCGAMLLDAAELLSSPRQAVSASAASSAAAIPMIPYFFTDQFPFLSGRTIAPLDFAQPATRLHRLVSRAARQLSAGAQNFHLDCQPNFRL